MQLSDFDYHLPSELIAQTPIEPRDQARLLVYRRLTGELSHHHIYDLPTLLPPKSLVIANNSQVRRSRLWALTDDQPPRKFEVLFLESVQNCYRCILGGRGRKVGKVVQLYQDVDCTQRIPLRATIIQEEPGPGLTTYLLEFNEQQNVPALLETYANIPLPPYITSKASRPDQYQTIYASALGSAAAPTAGLHFTPELLDQLCRHQVTWAEVTLHVGLGTFLPLRQNDLAANTLHTEQCWVSATTADLVNQGSQFVTAIGTTSARTLESHTHDYTTVSGWQPTNLFIYPGYTFQTVNGLLTNFHLPKSSLLMLVAALLGNHPTEHRLIATPPEMVATLHRIYQEAIAERYRFFSFGDAMLIL